MDPAKSYQDRRDRIEDYIRAAPPELQEEFSRLKGIAEMVFAHNIRRGSSGKPLCTLSSGPESVECGSCIFCYIRALEDASARFPEYWKEELSVQQAVKRTGSEDESRVEVAAARAYVAGSVRLREFKNLVRSLTYVLKDMTAPGLEPGEARRLAGWCLDRVSDVYPPARQMEDQAR